MMESETRYQPATRQHPRLINVFGHPIDQLKEALAEANATIVEKNKRIKELESQLAVPCRETDSCIVTRAERRALMLMNRASFASGKKGD
jgi:wobble nucleotide-excising tRNase